ncbi:MAG: TIGR03617 family F420-dependent LLM class oxidoreductase [Acidimicrobiales bacterium]
MTLKIDIVLTAGLPDVRELVAELGAAGVDGVATVEGPHDVFVPLVQAATAGVDIASYVAIAFPRSPVHLAHTAWDLQSLSGGRFRLGLGTQVRAHVERRHGSDFDHPVARMQEWVEAVRAVFACWQDGTPLSFEGRFTTHTMMPPLLSPPPLDVGPPPILVGALGPRMLAMTTACADGIVLHPMTSEPFLTDVVDRRIPSGLAGAGRSRDDFEVVAGALVGIHGDDDAEPVRDALRGMVAFYGSTPAYRPVLDSIGAGAMQPELQELTRAGRWGDLAATVDDTILDQVTVIGTATEVAGRLSSLYLGRADRLSLTFVQPLPVPRLAEVLDRLAAV